GPPQCPRPQPQPAPPPPARGIRVFRGPQAAPRPRRCGSRPGPGRRIHRRDAGLSQRAGAGKLPGLTPRLLADHHWNGTEVGARALLGLSGSATTWCPIVRPPGGSRLTTEQVGEQVTGGSTRSPIPMPRPAGPHRGRPQRLTGEFVKKITESLGII